MIRAAFRHTAYVDDELLSQINEGFISLMHALAGVDDQKLRVDYRLETISSVCEIFKSAFAKFKLRVLTIGMFREVFFGGLDKAEACSIYDMERNAISNFKNERGSHKTSSLFIKKTPLASNKNSFVVRDKNSDSQIRDIQNSSRPRVERRFGESEFATNTDKDINHLKMQNEFQTSIIAGSNQQLPPSPQTITMGTRNFVANKFQVEQLNGKVGQRYDEAVLENCVLKKELIITPGEIDKISQSKRAVLSNDPAMEVCSASEQSHGGHISTL